MQASQSTLNVGLENVIDVDDSMTIDNEDNADDELDAAEVDMGYDDELNAEVDMDHEDDNDSFASSNSHFTRSEGKGVLKQSSRRHTLTHESFLLVDQVVNEPRAYGPDDFSVEAAPEHAISALLFGVSQKYNIPDEGYSAIIDIINNKLIPVIGNAKTRHVVPTTKCNAT